MGYSLGGDEISSSNVRSYGNVDVTLKGYTLEEALGINSGFYRGSYNGM